MVRVVIMLGAPGAGKGTQAVRLSGRLGLPHVSTGDLFRDNLARGTQLGGKAREYMESGRLVPDELVVDMLLDRVSEPDCGSGFLLDGFPRTLPQAEVLDARVDPARVRAIELEVPDEVIVERIAGRLQCRECGSAHHQRSAPPRRAGVCDACGGELFQRDDDRSEVVRERLAVYHEQTRPVEGYYRESGRLCAVDGVQQPEAVFSACLRCLGEEA